MKKASFRHCSASITFVFICASRSFLRSTRHAFAYSSCLEFSDHRLDCCFNLGFEVVALIDHVRDLAHIAVVKLGGVADFVEDAEGGVRVDAAHGQIVVGVFAVVEVEAA